MTRRQERLLVAGFVAALIACAVLWFWFNERPRVASVPASARVALESSSSVDWFSIAGGKLVPEPGPTGFPDTMLTVLAAAPVSAATTLVLGQVEHTTGQILAKLHTDGSYTPLVVDGAGKQGLAARPDGYAAFAESGKSGPPMLMIINATGGSARAKPAGSGRPLSLLPDGRFLAATPSGLIGIDPLTLATSSFIGSGSMVAAASPDGLQVATFNPYAGTIDIYSVSSLSRPTYEYSLHESATALGFLEPGLLLAQLSATSSVLYKLSTSAPLPAGRFTPPSP